jgi:hypothetical protein
MNFNVCYLGGIGRLTDGIIGGNDNPWIAWNKSPVSIKFYFDTSRHFKIIRIYFMNNKYRSIEIKFDNYRTIKHEISSIETSLSTVFVDTIYLNKYEKTMFIGKQIEILFEFDNQLLFLTEITFDNQPSIIVNTTNCHLGKENILSLMKSNIYFYQSIILR